MTFLVKLLKYLLYWSLSGIIGMYLTYGAVKYVYKKTDITANHIINGAILGPTTLCFGIGGWIFILAAELKILAEENQ